MNKNLRNFMSIVMIGTVLSTRNVYARDFKDITSNGEYKWAYASVNRLQEKKVFGGYEDGTFRPSRPVSFLETMQIIKNIKNPSDEEIKQARSKFSVVTKKYKIPAWANDAVCYSLNNNTITEATLKSAYNRGFLKEINTVYPDRNSVTVYFGRALGFKGNGDLNLLKHKDKNSISEMTKGYLADLISAGIYSSTGSDGMFNGKKHIRRVEVAVIADKALNYISKTEIKDESAKAGDLTAGLSTNITGQINFITLSGEASTIRINGQDYKIYINNVRIKDKTGAYKGDILTLKDANVTASVVNNEVISLQINSLNSISESSEKGVNIITDENNTEDKNVNNADKKENNLGEKTVNIVGKVVNTSYTGAEYEIEVYIIASDTAEFTARSNMKVFSKRDYKIGDIVNIKGIQLNDQVKDLHII